MAVTHPHVVPQAFVLGNAVVMPAQYAEQAKRVLNLVKRIPTLKAEYRTNVKVQRACAFTLFEGQHVQHHESREGDFGDSISIFYRFPREVSDDEAADWFYDNGIEYTPRVCQHEYDCCGHWYSNGSYTHNDRKRTLVQITWYRNV